MTLFLLLNPKCFVDPWIRRRADTVRAEADTIRKERKLTEVEEAEIIALPKEGVPEKPEKEIKNPETTKAFSGFTGISQKILDLERQLAAIEQASEAFDKLQKELEQLEQDRIELAHQILLMRDEEEIAALLLLLN